MASAFGKFRAYVADQISALPDESIRVRPADPPRRDQRVRWSKAEQARRSDPRFMQILELAGWFEDDVGPHFRAEVPAEQLPVLEDAILELYEPIYEPILKEALQEAEMLQEPRRVLFYPGELLSEKRVPSSRFGFRILPDGYYYVPAIPGTNSPDLVLHGGGIPLRTIDPPPARPDGPLWRVAAREHAPSSRRVPNPTYFWNVPNGRAAQRLALRLEQNLLHVISVEKARSYRWKDRDMLGGTAQGMFLG